MRDVQMARILPSPTQVPWLYIIRVMQGTVGFLSKESRQSARVIWHVLNFPLYDGNCSLTARRLLEVGDVDGAIVEWQRLADLGSGRARCVLAFVALTGTPSREPDIEEARRLASSALGGDRGYANYVLGCIALKERQVSSIAQCLGESNKAGFVPAATMLASLAIGARNASAKTKSGAERMLIKAAAAGHRPAQLALCSFYLHGRFGFAKRLLGLILFPSAIIKYFLSAKYRGFSVASFQYFIRPRFPLVAEAAKLALAKESFGRPRYLNVLRFTHIAAGAVAAVVAVSQSADRSYSLIAAGVAAVWPYAVSYFFASGTVARNLVSLAVYLLLVILITAFACDAYLGRIFEMRFSVWMYGGVAVVQTILLMLAGGISGLAAKRVVRTSEPVPHRQLIFSAHLALGFLAAFAVFMRPLLWHVEYLRRYGLDVVIHSLTALLPYVAVGLFALPLVTANRWKPKVYLGILALGTALAITSNSGLIDVPQGVVLMAQFIGFILAAEWALDGTEW
jgi:TPR repeat protein